MLTGACNPVLRPISRVSGLVHVIRTLLDFCLDELTQYADASTEPRRRQLELAHAAGLSVPEALLSLAPTHRGEGQQCGTIDQNRLAEMLRPVRRPPIPPSPPLRPFSVCSLSPLPPFPPFPPEGEMNWSRLGNETQT